MKSIHSSVASVLFLSANTFCFFSLILHYLSHRNNEEDGYWKRGPKRLVVPGVGCVCVWECLGDADSNPFRIIYISVVVSKGHTPDSSKWRLIVSEFQFNAISLVSCLFMCVCAGMLLVVQCDRDPFFSPCCSQLFPGPTWHFIANGFVAASCVLGFVFRSSFQNWVFHTLN